MIPGEGENQMLVLLRVLLVSRLIRLAEHRKNVVAGRASVLDVSNGVFLVLKITHGS